MPEIAEVKLTSEFINAYSNQEFVKLEKSEVSKIKTDLSEMTFKKFIICSKSRGKELTIDFIDSSVPFLEATSKKMKVTLGMSGAWTYFDPKESANEKWLKHSHLKLTDEKGWILSLYDVRRFAKWSWNDFDSRRGPCPLTEEVKFGTLISENIKTHKDFKKYKLCEILMSQKWFNGVGNYLRAEILYRLDKNPFMLASELTTEEIDTLISLTITCAKTAYKLGGGQLKDWKNPNGEDPSSFKEWMKCYGKMEKITDGTGRTFWFNKKWK
jgi:endonuclease VIII-like 1